MSAAARSSISKWMSRLVHGRIRRPKTDSSSMSLPALGVAHLTGSIPMCLTAFVGGSELAVLPWTIFGLFSAFEALDTWDMQTHLLQSEVER